MRWIGFAIACLLGGCESDPPALEVRSVSPARVCSDAALSLTITGEGFAAVPLGTLAVQSVAIPSVTMRSPTVTLEFGDQAVVHWDSARQLRVDVVADVLVEAEYAVTVRNPDGRSATLERAFERTASAGPRLDGIMPNRLCRAGGEFTLSGDGFQRGATVVLVDPVTGDTLQGRVVVESATQARVLFPDHGLRRNARLDVLFTNPDGCGERLARGVRVRPGSGCN